MSEQPRPAPPTSKRRAGTVLLFLCAFMLLGIGFLALYGWSLLDEMPGMKQLENPEVELSTVIYSADGEELARLYRQHRIWTPLDSISQHVIDALIATEDRRFFEHWGIDLYRTLSIPYHILRGDPQGASTITQQLARNLYDRIGYAVSLERKLKEMITAVQIEQNFTKREILELYLNMVPLGDTFYGIGLAAHTYFNTSPDSLSLLQSATLVGLLKGTSYYHPVRHPERARHRRNVVLYQMVKFGNLTLQRFERLRDEPLTLDYHPLPTNKNIAPYFVQRVRVRLERWAQRTGHNIYTEGLVVHTTLNARLQQVAKTATAQQMQGLQSVVDVQWSCSSEQLVGRTFEAYARYEKAHPEMEPFSCLWKRYPDLLDAFIQETDRYSHLVTGGASPEEVLQQLKANEEFLDSLKAAKTRLEVGFVALNPANGHVKAWVGGRNFYVSQYDHVGVARRQPGSTFKPFVYTAAIDNGYSPYYEIKDTWVTFINHDTGKRWRPGNFSGVVTNEMYTLKEGLAHSKNIVTVRLAKMIGIEHVAAYARRLGIDSPLMEVPSLALGTSAVTLLEMVSAYGAFANRGLHAEPVLITRIEDRKGNLLAQFEPQVEVALSEQTAYTMINMLRGVTRPGGTGYRIRSQFGITHDVVGKTGTTQNGTDGWFILIHPQLVAGAWVGFNDQRVTFQTTFWGQGAHNALFVVGEFFRRAIHDSQVPLADVAFTPPENYRPPQPSDTSHVRSIHLQQMLPTEW